MTLLSTAITGRVQKRQGDRTMATKTEYLQIRVSPKLKDELKRMAAAELRSVSSLVEVIVTEWLAAHKKR